jgi:hypothetical protein
MNGLRRLGQINGIDYSGPTDATVMMQLEF